VAGINAIETESEDPQEITGDKMKTSHNSATGDRTNFRIPHPRAEFAEKEKTTQNIPGPNSIANQKETSASHDLIININARCRSPPNDKEVYSNMTRTSLMESFRFYKKR